MMSILFDKCTHFSIVKIENNRKIKIFSSAKNQKYASTMADLII